MANLLIQTLTLLLSVTSLLAATTTFPGQADQVKLPLPGLSTPTAYHHYSGYLSTGKNNATHLHYWFFESQSGNASHDPVVLWLNGGPGCSSMLGAVTELGPLLLTPNETLVPNPNAWTKVANVLFLETPAGVGFSYHDGDESYVSSDNATAALNFAALQAFYTKFPQFKPNDFYIAGESYAGVYIPTLAQHLLDHHFPVNFRGIVIGNGLLDTTLLGSSLIHFHYYHGMLDSSAYQNVLTKCCAGGGANSTNFDLSKCEIATWDQTMECLLARSAAVKNVDLSVPINPYNIYKRCAKTGDGNGSESTNPNSLTPHQLATQLYISLLTKNLPNYPEIQFTSSSAKNSPPCINFNYLEHWINQAAVRRALNIVNASRPWVPCSFDVSMGYERQYDEVAAEVKRVVDAGKKVLIYNGDVDSVCNFLGDQWFVDSLGYKVIKPTHPWYLHDQVVGFTKQYEKNLTFTTIKGAGHTVPEDKPEEAYQMFKDFISGK